MALSAITDRNWENVYVLAREMLPVFKVCTLLTQLAVEGCAADAPSRGQFRPLNWPAIFAPVILQLALMVDYTRRMRAH